MRYQNYLKERYRALLGYTGGLVALIGALHLVPLLLLPFYPEEGDQAIGFLVAGLPLVLGGAVVWQRNVPTEPLTVTLQEGAVMIVVVWLIAIACGTIPLMIDSQLSFSQAWFESTSGWTTTGLSVVDVISESHLVLFFRSFVQFAGGAGFAIIALSAVARVFGTGLVAAEGRTDQLAPNVRHSASIVLQMYAGYIILGTLALRAAGMDWFDAGNHALTALSTGGFSTRAESIGYWDSARVEAVILVLMLLGATNFLVAYTVLRGKWRAVIRSGEIRLMAVLVFVVSVLLFLLMTAQLYPTLTKSLRVAVFETVSAATTTGFSTVGYSNWTDFGWLMLIILMLIGGGTGSTAGGIKHMRIYVLYKAIYWEVRRAFMPPHMINEPMLWQGENRELLTDKRVRQVALFVGLYITVFLVGTGVMTAYGYTLGQSMFETASVLGTVGLSLGVTAPDMPVVVMWLMSIGMLLARLEFFAVFIGVIKISADVYSLTRRHDS